MIKFNATKDEQKLIRTIAERASELFNKLHGPVFSYSPMDAAMDIEACHCNGMPLNLPALAEAATDEEHYSDFIHDTFGIRRRISRTTGKLGDNFVPRFHLKKAKAQ